MYAWAETNQLELKVYMECLYKKRICISVIFFNLLSVWLYNAGRNQVLKEEEAEIELSNVERMGQEDM